MEPTNYASLAKGEATKRLISQLVNERLVVISLPDGIDQPCAHINGPDTTAKWITLPVMEGLNPSTHFRPNDFGTPVKLCSDDGEIIEEDPGSIFTFTASWFVCDEKTKLSIVDELRNSASMLEKWMELGSKAPILDINSSFIDWERSLIAGHPTHPFHRTCFANHLLPSVTPDDIPNLLSPGMSFVSVPSSSIQHFGPFDNLLQPLLKLIGVPPPSTHDDYTIVPCLSRHLPALLHFFPEATLVKSVDGRALAQASIRTVSVPSFDHDLKLSLACLITSGLRVLPCYSAEAAPAMTRLLKGLIPQDLWLCGEVAAVTGSQPNTEEAQYITCILRENLELRAEENNESIILVAALLERPRCGTKTYAEILFNLETTEDKVVWLKSYLRKLLSVALDPVTRHGVAFEFHAQNAVVRVCRRTKAIKGFAIRDLGGVRMHRPTLESQGFDLKGMDESLTDDVHQVWDRTHHVLIQNHIGYLIYSLRLEREYGGWQLVFSELERALEGDGDSTSQKIFHYLVKSTMPFKAFLRMRMESAMSVVNDPPYG
ncbi:unnamed protein product [Fusarium graminearum]|uniref:Uncharacterized protein n=1 Tax=Gibberella zeae TaxID=5518 RepID=A0A9N8R8P9_GIBZA|nr:unnamed protein product [Fusarium graminearum]